MRATSIVRYNGKRIIMRFMVISKGVIKHAQTLVNSTLHLVHTSVSVPRIDRRANILVSVGTINTDNYAFFLETVRK